MSVDHNPYQAPAIYDAVASDIIATRARRKIGPPTIGMLVVTSLVFVVVSIYSVAVAAFATWVALTYRGVRFPIGDEAPFAITVIALLLLGSGLASYGIWQMRRFRSYRWAIVGSISAMLLWPLSFFLIPLAIWGLVVLRDADVREMFRRCQDERSGRNERQ